MDPAALVRLRLQQLKNVANDGYGVVPITNDFTQPGSHHAGPAYPRNALVVRSTGDGGVGATFSTWPTSTNVSRSNLMLVQVCMPGGRFALFQTTATCTSAPHAPLASLVGSQVLFEADEGLDLGVIRTTEPIRALTRDIPECAFVNVVREATKSEVASLQAKFREEDMMLTAVRALQAKFATLSGMRVVRCEFQFDRKKLILFADMLYWTNFNAFVKAVRAKCEDLLGYRARIFIQRRFIKSF